MSEDLVRIRRTPTPADIARIGRAAQAAVLRLAETKAALGSAEIQRLYLAEVWAAVTACAVQERKPRRDRRSREKYIGE